MRSFRNISVLSLWLSTLFVLAFTLVAGSASAGGRVQWASTTLKERSTQSWQIEVKIFLPSAPDVPHVPMKFEFQPISYFERTMVDGDKLQERTVPLEGRQAMIESVDVGFMDPGSGKIELRTKFSFKVTRAHGYEAGEYRVTIRDARNGQMVGTPSTLRFDGENEVIDRRSIVFTGEKKKKKEEPKKVEGDAAEPAEGATSEEGSSDSGEPAQESSDPEPEATDDSGEDTDQPQEINEKPGGCGCRVAGSHSSTGNLMLGLSVALALGALGRRRRA